MIQCVWQEIQAMKKINENPRFPKILGTIDNNNAIVMEYIGNLPAQESSTIQHLLATLNEGSGDDWVNMADKGLQDRLKVETWRGEIHEEVGAECEGRRSSNVGEKERGGIKEERGGSSCCKKSEKPPGQ